MNPVNFFALVIFLSTSSFASDAKPIRYARLHGTIEKITVGDIKSVKSGLAPKGEKVCDIDLKVPVVSHFDGEGMASSSPCTTTIQGKPAKVFVMGRMYLETGAKGKASKKAGDLLLFVDSQFTKTSETFAGGAYTSELSLKDLSLWYDTRSFEADINSKKTAEHFTVNVTFEDQAK